MTDGRSIEAASAAHSAELVDILDRVLDRGIVIEDAVLRLDVAGLAFAGIEAYIIVTYVETYLDRIEATNEALQAREGSDPGSRWFEPPSLRGDELSSGRGR